MTSWSAKLSEALIVKIVGANKEQVSFPDVFIGTLFSDWTSLPAAQALLERTGYTLDVTTGQRKYGGPPPEEVFSGTQPGVGTEVRSALSIPITDDCQKVVGVYQCRADITLTTSSHKLRLSKLRWLYEHAFIHIRNEAKGNMATVWSSTWTFS